MIVSMILDNKGREVMTIAPTATVGEAVAELARHKIGALVVVEGRDRIVGIISERDVVRAVARGIATYLSEPVTSIMTREVMTCGERETINERHVADDPRPLPPHAGRQAGTSGRHHLDRRRRQGADRGSRARGRGDADLYRDGLSRSDEAGEVRA